MNQPADCSDLSGELMAALYLLVSVVGDSARAWEICEDVALVTPDAAISSRALAAVPLPSPEGNSSNQVAAQIASLPLTPQQLRATVEALSCVLLGASFGSALALQLIQMRSALHLSISECLRLTAVAWPQVMYDGHWTAWYPVLTNLADRTENLTLTLSERLALLDWLSICGRWLGAFGEAQGWIDRALELANLAHDPVNYARFTVSAGSLQRLRGRLLSAESTISFARSQFTKLDDQTGVQRCQIELAQIALERAQPARALELIEDLPATAQVSALRGEALLMSGEYQEAAALLVDITVASRPNLGRAQALLSQTYLQAGKHVEARETVAHAVEILQSTADVLGHARALALLGEILLESGDVGAAVALLEQALARQQTAEDYAGQRRTLTLLLQAYPILIEQALERRELDTAQHATARLVEYSQALQQQASRPET